MGIGAAAAAAAAAEKVSKGNGIETVWTADVRGA